MVTSEQEAHQAHTKTMFGSLSRPGTIVAVEAAALKTDS